ncbi:uracil nucleotide/cysteinyl leukotriene receptor [Gouania willdenowi]|uniref:uracil nucleotide/cysteinyl leukotriene receptor n=1 Tax=Gouania willdenowi TaxID=441366 RepID=UPI001055BCBB|nr:uracil nucleotide/cysteinyl leukotriene receptor-like [Gouania willdenowi]
MNVTNTTSCSEPPEQYQHYLFPVVYIITIFIGLPGNLAFLSTFRASPRTAFSVYIRNLAVADLLILCVLPFRVHYHLHWNDWAFGDVACRITGSVFFANTYLSICFMSCICVDRYMATVHPHIYLRLRNSCCSMLVSGTLWCVAGVAVLVFNLMGPLETEVDHQGHRRRCFENFAKKEWLNRMGHYSIMSLIFFSLLPSVIILVCYPLAARRISKIRTKAAKRAVKIICIILVITLLCFLPNHVVYLLQVLHRNGIIQRCSSLARAVHIARRVTTAMLVLNTCLDPVLYYVTSNHCSCNFRRMWLWGRVARSRRVYTITVK